MEIHSTRLDAGNPFARQQQLASSVRHSLNRLPPKTRAQLLAQAMPPVQPQIPMPQSAMSYRVPVPVPVAQATATPVQPVTPTMVYRPQVMAQPLSWQLALLLNGIRLSRRVQKVWAREMKDAKQELRWWQRHLLRALARRWGPQGASAGNRRVLPAHKAIRGATAQRFARR
jgi:hypothetical protein